MKSPGLTLSLEPRAQSFETMVESIWTMEPPTLIKRFIIFNGRFIFPLCPGSETQRNVALRPGEPHNHCAFIIVSVLDWWRISLWLFPQTSETLQPRVTELSFPNKPVSWRSDGNRAAGTAVRHYRSEDEKCQIGCLKVSFNSSLLTEVANNQSNSNSQRDASSELINEAHLLLLLVTTSRRCP